MDSILSIITTKIVAILEPIKLLPVSIQDTTPEPKVYTLWSVVVI